MRRPVVGAVLFGVGMFFVVAGVALSIVVTPLLTRLPYNLEYSRTMTDAKNATFLQVKAVGSDVRLEVVQADLRATTEILSDATTTADTAAAIADHAVVWKAYTDVRRTDTGELINASESRFAIDRTSAVAVNWGGQCLANQPEQKCQPGSISYAGLIYKFPFGTEKRNYQYFDSELHKDLPVSYKATETIGGLEVYRFDQAVDEQPLETDAGTLSLLIAKLSPDAKSATVRYRANRSIWVEPVTGTVVQYKQQVRRVFVPDSGPTTVMFDAAFQYSDETHRDLTDQARDNRRSLMMFRWYLPIGLGLLGFLLLVAGVLMVRRRPDPRKF